jgi:hypothetical protein
MHWQPLKTGQKTCNEQALENPCFFSYLLSSSYEVYHFHILHCGTFFALLIRISF